MSRTNFHTNPATLARAIAAEVSVTRPPARLVLGLDLGTVTGYCYAWLDRGVIISSKLIAPRHMGQLDLSAGPYDSGAIRFVRLRHFLAAAAPDLVVYEDVKSDPPGIAQMPPAAALARVATASELLGAFKATVCTWCEEGNIPCTGFKIGTIKKRATGRGNCNKEDMIKAANQTFGSRLEVEGYETTGVDNCADAAWICLLGLEQYGDGLPLTEVADDQPSESPLSAPADRPAGDDMPRDPCLS